MVGTRVGICVGASALLYPYVLRVGHFSATAGILNELYLHSISVFYHIEWDFVVGSRSAR